MTDPHPLVQARHAGEAGGGEGTRAPAQPPPYTEAPSRPLAINYKEAARLIGRSPRTIQLMIEREELTKLKDVALVEYASLVAWVEEQCRV